MQLSNYSHVIFDFDGTLADLLIDWTGWHTGIRQIVANRDPKLPLEGKIQHEHINSFIKTYGDSMRTELWSFNESYEQEQMRGVEPITHAMSALKNLRPDQEVYLLTSNSRKTILPVLADLEISDLFKKVITRDDVLFIKPDAQPFSLIAAEPASTSKYVMIGDSTADQGFAETVNISFIHVNDLER